MADGSRVATRVYLGSAELTGLSGSYPIAIAALGDEAIVGRGLTDRFLLILDHGRRLTIEA
jgi:hypothetical protein